MVSLIMLFCMLVRKTRIKWKNFILIILVDCLALVLVSFVVVQVVNSLKQSTVTVIAHYITEFEELDFTTSTPKTLRTGPFAYSVLRKDTTVQLDMLVDEVMQQPKIKSLKGYKYLSKQLLMGIPCVETSGKMEFQYTDSLFDSLMKANESVSGAMGLYQIKDSSRWLSQSFDSVYVVSKSNLNFKRPNPLYTPDAMYSLAYAFSSVELPHVVDMYNTYIENFKSKYNISLTQSQYNEIVQVLGCDFFHGRIPESHRQQLIDFVCYSSHLLGSFGVLSEYSTDDFHTSVRLVLLGTRAGNGELPEMKKPLLLMNGEILNKPLIDYVDEKIPDSGIMISFRHLLNNASNNGNVFINYAYGIGALACGEYRVRSVEARFSDFYANVSDAEDYILAQEYCRINNIPVTKKYVPITVELLDYSVGFDVGYYITTVGDRGFPMFSFDGGNSNITDTVLIEGKEFTFSRIENNKRYMASSHICNRAYLVDLPNKFVNAKNMFSNLVIDIRVIPALNELHNAWEYFKTENGIESDISVEVVSAFRTQEQANAVFIMWANDLKIYSRSDWTDSEEDIQFLINLRNDPSYTSNETIRHFKNMVAEPMTSAHHTGRVLDFTETSDDTYYKWLITNCKVFGFHNYSKERWHFEYNPKGVGQ